MHLKKTKKIAIGIGTAWLLTYLLAISAVSIYRLVPAVTAVTNNLPLAYTPFPQTFPFQNFILTMPLSLFGLMGFYLLHLNFNQELTRKTKAYYFLGIQLLFFIGIPIYFVNCIWRGGTFQFLKANHSKNNSITKQKLVVSNHETTVKWYWLAVTNILEILFICISAFVIFFSFQSRSPIAQRLSIPASAVAPRTIQPSGTATLLWSKQIRLDSSSIAPKLFPLENQNILYWDYLEGSLVTINKNTGEVIWDAKVPFVRALEIEGYDIYISTYAVGERWEYPYSKAALDRGKCANSFYDEAALSSYDSRTGKLNWGYLYPGVDIGYLSVDSGRIYLKGFHEYNTLESVMEVDAQSGDILGLICQESQEIKPPAGESPSLWDFKICCEDRPYQVVPEYVNLKKVTAEQYFIIYDSHISVVNEAGETTNQLNFEGYRLDSRNITLTVSDNIVILYLLDSDQLFAFQLE